MRYICVNDRYDEVGEVPYESVEAFAAMCQECFGERPTLTTRLDDNVYDDRGELVLVPR